MSPGSLNDDAAQVADQEPDAGLAALDLSHMGAVCDWDLRRGLVLWYRVQRRAALKAVAEQRMARQALRHCGRRRVRRHAARRSRARAVTRGRSRCNADDAGCDPAGSERMAVRCEHRPVDQEAHGRCAPERQRCAADGEAALDLARMGFQVLPLHNPVDGGGCSCGNAACPKVGKHARTRWRHAPALTEADIRSYWRRCRPPERRHPHRPWRLCHRRGR